MKNKKIPNVLIIQRAIPHYRMPLFEALNKSNNFNLTLCIGDHDPKTATGLAAEDLGNLKIIQADVKRFPKEILIQKIINLKGFDIIITDVSINLLSLPIYILYAKILGIKVIGWGKGMPQDTSKKENIIKRKYKKIIGNSCDSFILYGEISKKYLFNLGLKSKPMVIAQNTIDTQKLIEKNSFFKTEASALKVQMNLVDKFIFGYFGKLTERKKVDKIIDAFIKLKKETNNNSILIIAGTGQVADKLKLKANNSPFNKSIYFLGKINIGQEGVIINLFDAFLSFSQGGLGILEAMALSKLIISTPELFPETELLENNYNCLLSKDFSIKEFSIAMKKALDLGEKKLKIEENVFNTVKENATIEKMVNAFEIIINSNYK